MIQHTSTCIFFQCVIYKMHKSVHGVEGVMWTIDDHRKQLDGSIYESISVEKHEQNPPTQFDMLSIACSVCISLLTYDNCWTVDE